MYSEHLSSQVYTQDGYDTLSQLDSEFITQAITEGAELSSHKNRSSSHYNIVQPNKQSPKKNYNRGAVVDVGKTIMFKYGGILSNLASSKQLSENEQDNLNTSTDQQFDAHDFEQKRQSVFKQSLQTDYLKLRQKLKSYQNDRLQNSNPTGKTGRQTGLSHEFNISHDSQFLEYPSPSLSFQNTPLKLSTRLTNQSQHESQLSNSRNQLLRSQQQNNYYEMNPSLLSRIHRIQQDCNFQCETDISEDENSNPDFEIIQNTQDNTHNKSISLNTFRIPSLSLNPQSSKSEYQKGHQINQQHMNLIPSIESTQITSRQPTYMNPTYSSRQRKQSARDILNEISNN